MIGPGGTLHRRLMFVGFVSFLVGAVAFSLLSDLPHVLTTTVRVTGRAA